MGGVIILALSLGFVRQEVADTDDVDIVEVNHYYDGDGKHVFDQAIFYVWNDEKSRFDVIAWRLIKKPGQVPHRIGNRFVSVWHDAKTLRRVRARIMRESWTQFDPELLERKTLPQEDRPGLSFRKFRR